MKQITRLAVLFCFLVAVFQIPIIICDAEGQMTENSKSTLPYGSQLVNYSYSDDFSTRKAEMDSYDHSPFYDSLPGVSLSGFLMYMYGQVLGFFRGFDPYMYACLCYEFPLEGDLGIMTAGTLEVDVYIGWEWDAGFSVCTSYDGSSWECFGPIESGHYVYILSPEDSCTSLFLRFVGGGTYLDNFSLSLTLSDNTSVDTEESESRWSFELSQNYPNPFNLTTNIEFLLSKSGHVKIEVFNTLGEKVRTLVGQHLKAGQQLVHWDGKDDSGKEVASGVYFYRINAGESSTVKKMIFMR